MNCYICGGFLLSKDKHTVEKKNFHKNCWSRLDRKQQKLIQDGNILNFTIKNFKNGYPDFVNKSKNIPIF